eukprot:2510457-Karenia_brevis.AAC.1
MSKVVTQCRCDLMCMGFANDLEEYVDSTCACFGLLPDDFSSSLEMDVSFVDDIVFGVIDTADDILSSVRK